MLCVLDQSEKVYKETGTTIKMFASITTIRAWRLSIRSAIALIEEMFNAGFHFVLTGKWNQDPLEVCKQICVHTYKQINYSSMDSLLFLQRLFGIVRSVNNHPSVTSWLQIIRYVTLQSRLNTARRNANIDDGERVECLVSLAKCLKKHRQKTWMYPLQLSNHV